MYSSQQGLLKVTLKCIKKQPKQHGLIPGQLIFANARREPDRGLEKGIHRTCLVKWMGGRGETTSSAMPWMQCGTWGDARTNYCTSGQVSAESELTSRHCRKNSKRGKMGKKGLRWKTQCRDAGGSAAKVAFSMAVSSAGARVLPSVHF